MYRPHRHLLALLFSAGLLALAGCQPSEECGNGKVEGSEQCDDGNRINGDACSNTCTKPVTAAVCGNGELETGEFCDDGNSFNNDGCQNDCTITPDGQVVLQICGNGKREIGEACDDGNTTDGDGCESTCVLTRPSQTQCAGAASLPQPEAGATCKLVPPTGTANGARLFMGVVLMDGQTLNGGQVLVNAAGRITCAACDCSGEAEAAAALRVSCPQGVISPGLINGHDHIDYQKAPPAGIEERFEHRHEWRIGGAAQGGHTRLNNGGTAADAIVAWAELRQVMSGTTAVASSGGTAGFLRDLASSSVAQREGLQEQDINFQTFPLGDSSGLKLTSGCAYPSINTPSVIPSLSAYLPHVSEGISEAARNEFRCVSGQGDRSQNLLGGHTAIIHGVGLTATEIAKMAETGTGLIWSPRSNESLYGETAMIPAYKRLGVTIALGTDWLQSGSMNILRELQCADYLNQVHFSQELSDEHLWRMVTANAADLTDTWEKLGRIAPGKLADLAIFRLRSFAFSPHRAVITAGAEDVVLTLRGGKALYGDAALVEALKASGDSCDTLDVCATGNKSVCVKSERAGKTFADLKASNTASYPLFFCDAQPTNEPTCEPRRTATTPVPASVSGSTVYTGTRTLQDSDGDGIPNAQDNCPITFNPVRPLDGGKQVDTDNDGVGDACDVCPLEANSTTCATRNPADRDGDGVLSPADNCPGVANKDQKDTDGDGRGDACDVCPTANPGDATCALSIYELKTPVNGTRPLVGFNVAISSAVVTAVKDKSYFIQVPDAERDARGADYSGVYVFSSATDSYIPKVGDHITLTSARVSDYFGQMQLTSVMAVQHADKAKLTPTPVVVPPSQINTGGSRAEALEGVLVQLDNVYVTQVEPPVGAGDTAPTSEFVVDSVKGGTTGVRVNDLFYKPSPLPTVDTLYVRVRGVLERRNENSKVEPRDETDLLPTLPAIASFGSASPQFIRVSAACDPAGCSLIGSSKLLVTLERAHPEALEVTVTSADPAALTVANGGKVTIAKGATSAEVKLIPRLQASAVALTASLGTSSKASTVRVLGAAEQSTPTLSPKPIVTAAGSDVTVTATLDLPAPAGTSLEFVVEPAGLGTVSPATVPVAENATQVTFTFKTSASATTDGTLTARVAGTTNQDTAAVQLVLDLPSLVSLTPTPVTVVQGTTQTFTVTLSKAAPGAQTVTLKVVPPSTGTFGTVPTTVTVPTGATSADFTFSADAAANGSGSIEASLGGTTRTAAVTVRAPYPKLASIAPLNATVGPGATQLFTITLDKGADPGGASVAVSLDSSAAGSLAASTVTIAAGATSGTVLFTASNTQGASANFSATFRGETLTTPVHVANSRKGLVINELDFDQPGTDNKEFVELYNSSSTDVSLANLAIVFVNGTGNVEYHRADLASVGTLGPGEYLIVGSKTFLDTLTTTTAKKLAIKSASNAETDIIQNGSPDGLGIYDKLTDTLVDSLTYEGDMREVSINGSTKKFSFTEGSKDTKGLEDYTVTGKDGTLSRIPNGQDFDLNADDFKFTTKITPGAPNEFVALP